MTNSTKINNPLELHWLNRNPKSCTTAGSWSNSPHKKRCSDKLCPLLWDI